MTPSMPATPESLRGRLITARTLDAASILCLVGVGIAFALPIETTTPKDSAGQSTSTATEASLLDDGGISANTRVHADSTISRVVGGNLFSATRNAPGSRFQLPGPPAAVDMSAVSSFTAPVANDSTMGATSSGDGIPRLSGLVTMNGERRALLQLSAADGVPSLYRAGDTHAGYRVVRIGSDHVVLSSRAGTRTLRLSASATPDSLEHTR